MTTPDPPVSIDLMVLAERCEKAGGPDRELDEAILDAVNPLAEIGPGLCIPHFTASLDAAMSLVPEGWHVADLGENWRAGGWRVTVAQRPTAGQKRAYEAGKTYVVQSEHGEAKTAALALCAAAIRARGVSGYDG